MNMVSKKLQCRSMSIDITTKELKGVMLFFKNIEMKGLNPASILPEILHSHMNIEQILSTKPRFLRKKQFDENDDDEEIQSAEEYFRVNYFLVVDMTIASLKDTLKDRIEQLKIFEIIFWIHV